MSERESIAVLRECIEVQTAKSHDYQNPNSTVKQADYYPNGILTINDVIHAKMLRVKSLLESGAAPKNESLEDSYKDLINYASFAVAWLRKKVPGQRLENDNFNRPDPSANTGGVFQYDDTLASYEAGQKAESLQEVQSRRSYPNKTPSTNSGGIY